MRLVTYRDAFPAGNPLLDMIAEHLSSPAVTQQNVSKLVPTAEKGQEMIRILVPDFKMGKKKNLLSRRCSSEQDLDDEHAADMDMETKPRQLFQRQPDLSQWHKERQARTERLLGGKAVASTCTSTSTSTSTDTQQVK